MLKATLASAYLARKIAIDRCYCGFKLTITSVS